MSVFDKFQTRDELLAAVEAALKQENENNYWLDDTQGEVDAYDGVRRIPTLYVCDRS